MGSKLGHEHFVKPSPISMTFLPFCISTDSKTLGFPS